KAFLAAGAKVIAIERSGIAGAIEADLTSADSTQEAMKAAQAIHGRIDSLIHLVGGFAGGADLANENPSTFDAMFNTNRRTTFNLEPSRNANHARRGPWQHRPDRQPLRRRAIPARRTLRSRKSSRSLPGQKHRGGKRKVQHHRQRRDARNYGYQGKPRRHANR